MRATDRFSPAARTAAVLVGILVCGAVCLAQAPPPPHKLTVADVLVRGNGRVPTQEIMAQVKTRVGGAYDPEVVQEDVRTLMATRRFGNVQPRAKMLPGDKVEVTFFV